MGANGCGKSTLLKTFAKLLKPEQGSILLDGKSIFYIPSKQMAQTLGLLPQSPVVPEGIKVTDLVARGRFPYRKLLGGLQKEDFAAGRPVKVEGMIDKDGKTFSASLQVSAVERGIEFLPKGFQQNQQQQQGQNRKPYQWVDENGNIRAPKTIGGVALTEEQQKKFTAEETIYVKGMKKDGQDQPYNAYIKFNREKGKPDFSRANPDKAQAKEIVPVSKSRTQVAVNSDGKTNEATKHQKEPLKQGQQKPTAGQKQNRVKKEQQEQKADKSQKADKPKRSKGIKL